MTNKQLRFGVQFCETELTIFLHNIWTAPIPTVTALLVPSLVLSKFYIFFKSYCCNEFLFQSLLSLVGFAISAHIVIFYVCLPNNNNNYKILYYEKKL